MPEIYIVASTAATVAAAFYLLFYVIPYLRDRSAQIPGTVPVAEILNRECHAAPAIPFTPEQAHWEMQELIDCDTRTCDRKYAAFWTMVDAGHATPSRGLAR